MAGLSGLGWGYDREGEGISGKKRDGDNNGAGAVLGVAGKDMGEEDMLKEGGGIT